MDSKLMLKYVDFLNDIRLNNRTQRDPAMLVYDSFRGHLEESVKKKLHESRFDLAVIPSGLTSVCQPLDVTINKPFKDNLRKEWHIWMAGGGAGVTAAGNLRRAKLSDVCVWVKNAWEGIPNEMIIESFKTCQISTSLDGPDDEMTDNEDGDDDDVIGGDGDIDNN